MQPVLPPHHRAAVTAGVILRPRQKVCGTCPTAGLLFMRYSRAMVDMMEAWKAEEHTGRHTSAQKSLNQVQRRRSLCSS